MINNEINKIIDKLQQTAKTPDIPSELRPHIISKMIDILQQSALQPEIPGLLWRHIIEIADRNESVRDLALKTLRTLPKNMLCPDYCLLYLFKNYPEMNQDLFNEFSSYKDANILVCLGHYWMQFNSKRGQALILDAIPLIDPYDHETWNSVELELDDWGNEEILVEIQRRMNIDTVHKENYDPFIATVKNKLSRHI